MISAFEVVSQNIDHVSVGGNVVWKLAGDGRWLVFVLSADTPTKLQIKGDKPIVQTAIHRKITSIFGNVQDA